MDAADGDEMLGLEAGQVKGAGHSGVEVWSGREGKLGTRRGDGGSFTC